MTIIPFPKYKKPITEILNYYQWNQSFHNLLKLHFTTVWHEVFTRVYFREFSEFSGESGKLNHAKMISCEKKFSRQFTSFLYRNEVKLNWLQTIWKPSFWQFKPNLKCLRSLCKFITLEKTIYWKTRHTWPRYMKTAWTCPVSMQTDRLMGRDSQGHSWCHICAIHQEWWKGWCSGRWTNRATNSRFSHPSRVLRKMLRKYDIPCCYLCMYQCRTLNTGQKLA